MDASEKENKFDKKALCESKMFKEKRDILSAVLEDDREYTKAEAEELIKNYLTKELV
ncbi:MAG: hypothetical protein LUD81_01720 [Clostridiales bacterium]|nr:hypothetical protein [Clostridiales bacterium]